jgi:hypothetical protein
MPKKSRNPVFLFFLHQKPRQFTTFSKPLGVDDQQDSTRFRMADIHFFKPARLLFSIRKMPVKTEPQTYLKSGQ